MKRLHENRVNFLIKLGKGNGKSKKMVENLNTDV